MTVDKFHRCQGACATTEFSCRTLRRHFHRSCCPTCTHPMKETP